MDIWVFSIHPSLPHQVCVCIPAPCPYGLFYVVPYFRPRLSIFYLHLAQPFTYPIRGLDHHNSLLPSSTRARGQSTRCGCFGAAHTYRKGDCVVLVLCSASRKSDTESSLATSSQSKGTNRGGGCLGVTSWTNLGDRGTHIRCGKRWDFRCGKRWGLTR